MYHPICFSQCFVNKENVRSFSNILNSKFLKSENNDLFLRNIFEEEKLVCEVSTELKEILSEVRHNIKSYSKHDFNNYLVLCEDTRQGLHIVDKSDVLSSCCTVLYMIIPEKFYGNLHNKNIFNNCTKIIVYSMKHQCLFLDKMISKWDLSKFPWSTVNTTLCFKILYRILHWIFKIILSSIISLNYYVTACKLNNDDNKLYYFLKNQWQRFFDIQLSKMVIAKVIKKFEPYCLGKRIRNKYSSEERLKLKMIKKSIFKLHLILKPNNDYRAIVRYKNEAVNSSEKYKIKERLNFLQTLTGKSYEKIENQFSSLHSLWKKNKQPKLYFVKTDLSNAFGSINKDKLLMIVNERYLEFLKLDNSSFIKNKFIKLYREMITELKSPLLIRAGSTIYEWKKGLVQGYKYSPALSELYYSYLDKIYFKEYFKKHSNEMKLFIRVVDDYLYITDTLEDAQSFLKALTNYRNVNFTKTFVNFQHPTIKFSEDITFLGYSYNTVNLEVSRASTVFAGYMCYKICFSPAISDLAKFIENRIEQSGIPVNRHIFNFNHNSEELIWHHIFVTFCLSANKFCTILAIYCDEKQMSQYLVVYKTKVAVKLCNSILDTLKKYQPPDFIFIYCINHFRYLAYKALLLCAQQTPKCNVLVPCVNIELAKTNCINGKWREHSSKICKRGKSVMPACREVCKRADLKIIMKSFDVLPVNVQCFNHKLFYNEFVK